MTGGCSALSAKSLPVKVTDASACSRAACCSAVSASGVSGGLAGGVAWVVAAVGNAAAGGASAGRVEQAPAAATQNERNPRPTIRRACCSSTPSRLQGACRVKRRPFSRLLRAMPAWGGARASLLRLLRNRRPAQPLDSSGTLARYSRPVVPMTRAPTVAWLNGKILAMSEASVPLEDRGLQFGESLYEVAAITGGRARLLREHAERMRCAAEIIGLGRGVPDADSWLALATELLSIEKLDEGILYAQVTGGSAPRAFVPEQPLRPTFFAYLRPFRFPRAEDVAEGIAAVKVPDLRWARRDLKTTMLLPAVLAKRDARARGAHEALLVGPDGHVNEGAASTVFAVEGRTLVTPRRSERSLPGTTGPIVRRLACDAGLGVVEEPLSALRLGSAHEIFVTSATLLLMPVVSVDGAPVGTGRPGPVALDLARRLRATFEID